MPSYAVLYRPEMAPRKAPSSRAYTGAVKRARLGLKTVRIATPKAPNTTGKIHPGRDTVSAVTSTLDQPYTPDATTSTRRAAVAHTVPFTVIASEATTGPVPAA